MLLRKITREELEKLNASNMIRKNVIVSAFCLPGYNYIFVNQDDLISLSSIYDLQVSVLGVADPVDIIDIRDDIINDFTCDAVLGTKE